ncbi:MAG: SAM-dependent methyltransferase [Rhodospirillales bacterium]|jgi:SAM-dependent MidA family methyltransferase|nr:SAM-dependent methyltransferase [Rhodospirillales bacterium]
MAGDAAAERPTDGLPAAERLDRFMARANAAYYATHDPFADFTTAPEIAQVFGELLGLWAAVAWDLLGRPTPVLLAEAGPGRGTLMADALRAIGQVAPAFAAALTPHLVETSPRLRAIQQAALPPAWAARTVWHERPEGLPDVPLLLLANEFLDALPVRQFVRRGADWTERHVARGAFVERPADRRDARLGDPLDGHAAAGWDGTLAEGTVVEVCEPARAFVAGLAARLARRPGAVLLLDYGPALPCVGDSLQALRAGRPADPLVAPGEADLTAHVDFPTLAAVARAAGAAVHGPLSQGILLTRLGLFQRTDRLARGQPPARAAALVTAARRLAEPHRMGRLFKALALCHPGCPTPPGFEA